MDLPTLLLLSRDKVPNIRIAIAKLLKESVLSIGRSSLISAKTLIFFPSGQIIVPT